LIWAKAIAGTNARAQMIPVLVFKDGMPWVLSG
jgi:hypothetical protein